MLLQVWNGDALNQLVTQLHKQHKLCGAEVHVSAPNNPTLIRCSQCDELGHSYQACPMYGGTAIRLLFKQPVDYGTLKRLVSYSGAKGGYLSNDYTVKSPHRVMTLLFRSAATGDSSSCSFE